MDLNEVIQNLPNYQKEITFILLFLIIFIVVFAVIKKIRLFDQNQSVPGILSIVVSLLSVWYLSEKQMLNVIYSYNVLGFLITFLLPYALIFLFLHKSRTTSVLRKSVWVIFGGIFVYIWYKNNNPIDIFFWGSIVLILGAIFLDESLHKGIQENN